MELWRRLLRIGDATFVSGTQISDDFTALISYVPYCTDLLNNHVSL
jgi:hypothetical protein